VIRRAAMLALVLLLHTLAHAAAAQPETDRLTVVPRLGLGGVVVTEHWTPLRFLLTSPEAIAGTLTVSYQQDGSQNASTTVRFSLTPGVPTPVDVGVCLRRYATGFGLVVRSDAGDTLLRDYLAFDDPTRARRVTFVPPMLVSEPTALLAVGFDGLDEVGRLWSQWLIDPGGGAFVREQDRAWTIERRLRLVAAEPEDLYAFWTAYEGAAAVLVRASAIGRVPDRARRALLEWQSGGGELIVVADDASAAWRRWLPEGPAGDLLAPGEPRRLPTPPSFMSIPTRVDRTGIGEPELAMPAEEINARLLELAPAARASGWTLDHTLADGGGLVARGPAGLGFVTVLGFDPARAMAVRSARSAASAWAAILESALEPHATDDPYTGGYFSGSGGSQPEAHAIARLVDAGVRGEGIGLGVVVSVLAVLVLFVLGIGPVDAIVLGRLRRRHWSWLTALVWVALASVLAAEIPSLTVGGRTGVGRLVVNDAVLDARGSASASWASAVTTIYAGRTGAAGPRDERPGAWWRGVSPLEMWQWGADNIAGAIGDLRLIQRPVLGDAGADESSLPGPLTQRGWTARALLDIAPAQPPIVARLARGDGLTLRLAAGPDAVTIVSASVAIGDRTWSVPRPALGVDIHLDEADGRRVDRPTDWSLRWAARDHNMDWAALADLPGARARGRAFNAFASGSDFAVIEILYTSTSPPVAFVGADTVDCSGAVRLAVPITAAPEEPTP
jgi:hypothetical protein